MFGIIAAFVFVTAFVLASGTIAWMFATYRDKMVAALLFEPMPRTSAVYHVRITRRRARPVQAPVPVPCPASLRLARAA